MVTDITGAGARRWFGRGRHLPTRRVVLATSGYIGVVVGLSIASSLTQDSVGPALYIFAAFLTLPIGFSIYPALFVNLFAAAAFGKLFGLGPGGEQAVIEVGVTVVFALAALVNSVLVRLMWQSVRGLRDPSETPPAAPSERSKPV